MPPKRTGRQRGEIRFGLLGYCGFYFSDRFNRISNNLHLDVRRDFAVELDGHRVVANALQRLRELYFATVDVKALGFESSGDVGRGDGAEKLTAIPGLACEAEYNGLQLDDKFLSLGLLRSGAACS